MLLHCAIKFNESLVENTNVICLPSAKICISLQFIFIPCVLGFQPFTFLYFQALKGNALTFRISHKSDVKTSASYVVPTYKSVTDILQWINGTL